MTFECIKARTAYQWFAAALLTVGSCTLSMAQDKTQPPSQPELAQQGMAAKSMATRKTDSSTLNRIKANGVIHLGFREQEPPFSFINEDGKPVGYSIDLCDVIASQVKQVLRLKELKVKYVPVTAENRFSAVASGQIDLLCGSTTQTVERRQWVDFSHKTFVTGAAILSHNSKPVKDYATLEGMKIGVLQGTTTVKALNRLLKERNINANVVPVQSSEKALSMILDGELNAFSADQLVLYGLLVTSEAPGEFKVSQEVFSYEPLALAMSRNDSDFRLLVDGTLSELSRSKVIYAIYKKWFGLFNKEMNPITQAMYRLNVIPR